MTLGGQLAIEQRTWGGFDLSTESDPLEKTRGTQGRLRNQSVVNSALSDANLE
jgi:hypothetical protein